jgi:hypothetical protein
MKFVNDNESPRIEKGMLKSCRLRIFVIDTFRSSGLPQGEVLLLGDREKALASSLLDIIKPMQAYNNVGA